jgi:hypothetical protein
MNGKNSVGVVLACNHYEVFDIQARKASRAAYAASDGARPRARRPAQLRGFGAY